MRRPDPKRPAAVCMSAELEHARFHTNCMMNMRLCGHFLTLMIALMVADTHFFILKFLARETFGKQISEQIEISMKFHSATKCNLTAIRLSRWEFFALSGIREIRRNENINIFAKYALLIKVCV